MVMLLELQGASGSIPPDKIQQKGAAFGILTNAQIHKLF